MAAIRQQASPTSSTCTAGGYTLPRTEFGVPSESLSHLDIVSEKLRKKNMGGERREYGRTADPQIRIGQAE